MIEITVIGDPAPQGSKRHVGGGRMIESCKRLPAWRDSVAWAGRESMGGCKPLEGPLVVSMVFTVRKPASAPKRRRTWPSVKPDLSKLARSTEDALTTAGVWKDDAQVVEYARLAKVYPSEDCEALGCLGARIKIWRVGESY